MGLVEAFKARGRTVLLTTHYMDEAERLCDRVAIVDHGKVIALGTPRELIASLGAEHVIEFAVDDAAPATVGGARCARCRASRASRPRTDAGASPCARSTALCPRCSRRWPSWRVGARAARTHHATLEDVFVTLTGRHAARCLNRARPGFARPWSS